MRHDGNKQRSERCEKLRSEKKAYAPPRILMRENVEVIAADCTAGKATPIDCSAVGVLQS